MRHIPCLIQQRSWRCDVLNGQVFLTADDVHVKQAQRRSMILPANRAAEIPARLWWQRDDVEFFLPTTTAKSAPIPATCNHGRWVVLCECGGAQLASADDPRFFCVSCLNERQGGKWRPVTWPEQRSDIEQVLRERFTENANWLPGESVEQLRAENIENGVSNGLV